MDSTNGTTGTVKLNTASVPPNGNVPLVGTSESPTDVDKQSISIHTQDWYLYALAAVVVLGFFGLTVLMMMSKMDPNNPHKDIVFMMFGGLVTGFSMVLSYFFGSSAGSAQKTLELAKIAKK
jgi:RsiW-degrading membrane proteinase PrsW (M82 family)